VEQWPHKQRAEPVIDNAEENAETLENNFVKIFYNTFMTDKGVLDKFKLNEEREPEISEDER
jgi:hypothetical protein